MSFTQAGTSLCERAIGTGLLSRRRHERIISRPLASASVSLSSANPQRDAHPLRLIVFGKPGSGKGTLSKRLVDKYGFKFVSCGDVLRRHILDKTELGQAAGQTMRSGGLLPDGTINTMVAETIDALREQPWILDGFPRTINQGEFLIQHLRASNMRISLVALDVPDSVIVDRISNRWIHESSGRVYNSSYNKPKIPGLDDLTGEPLVKRADDSPEVIAKRLQNYEDSTQPLLAYFREQNDLPFRVVSLQGSTTDEIWPKLVDSIEQWNREEDAAKF